MQETDNDLYEEYLTRRGFERNVSHYLSYEKQLTEPFSFYVRPDDDGSAFELYITVDVPNQLGDSISFRFEQIGKLLEMVDAYEER